MRTVRRGMNGFEVGYMQYLLNKARIQDGVGGNAIFDSGIFDQATENAVRAFQQRRRIVVDGIVGPQTWHTLGLRTEREHGITLFGQPTGTSCWSAAATMILGNQSAGPGRARLAPTGEIYTSVENIREFARSYGWQALNHTPGILEMVHLVQRTPVWITASGDGWGHAVVLSGVYSDGDIRGNGTFFRIHDPWPPRRGKIYYSIPNPIMLFSSDGLERLPANLNNIVIPG